MASKPRSPDLGLTLRAILVSGAMVLAAGVLTACVGASPEVSNGDPVLIEGREIYARSCAGCHGSAGQGGRGNALWRGTVVETYPDVAEQIQLVADGRNQMPAFKGKLDERQLEAVVRYTREVL